MRLRREASVISCGLGQPRRSGSSGRSGSGWPQTLHGDAEKLPAELRRRTRPSNAQHREPNRSMLPDLFIPVRHSWEIHGSQLPSFAVPRTPGLRLSASTAAWHGRRRMKILVIQSKPGRHGAVGLRPEGASPEVLDCALHVLVKEEAAPILRHLPWLTGCGPCPAYVARPPSGKLADRARLRRDEFDRSVDFGGNDRGATPVGCAGHGAARTGSSGWFSLAVLLLHRAGRHYRMRREHEPFGS